MSYYESMQNLIGNTPMVKLGKSGEEYTSDIFAKLELMNPAGSVKDRVGRYMIADAEEKGLLKPGGTIVEGTAGNTGIGIAFAALNKGYQVIFVVPDKFSMEKQKIMKALGAQIINTPRSEGMLGAAKKAEEIKASIKGAVSLQQFKNPSNPKAHYETTGPEIWKDMDGRIDYIVMGAGSGGTYSGVVQYLKEQDPNIVGVLADPDGSLIGGGTTHHDYNIEGIGNDFIPETMNIKLVDQVFKITDREAFESARELARKEGIIAGSSSGAAFAAVKKLAKTVDNKRIVVLFPDRGDRYFSTDLY